MSVESSIMLNMYYAGLIDKKEENNMAELKSLYNEYTIHFERKGNRWSIGGTARGGNYSNFNCIIRLSNNLGISILEINTTEINIFILVDNLYTLISTDTLKEINIPIQSIDKKFNQYTFYFIKNNENHLIEFYIYEINCIYHQKILRLKLLFDDKILDNFLNILYFIFLIDLDEESYFEENINPILL